MHPKLAALEKTFGNSILHKLDDPSINPYPVELWIKRDDLLHPVLSGNKWRKLKHCLNDAMARNCHTLVSMGGKYSNHLHALAYASQHLGIKAIGLVRGEATSPLTPTLSDCRNWGMELRFLSRSEYRQLRYHQDTNQLPGFPPGHYWLPEGGATNLALAGVAELIKEIDVPFDVLCLPCGTGTTLAGCVAAVPESVSVLGIAALKNARFLASDVAALVPEASHHWTISHDYHFGGFAEGSPELLSFMKSFEARNSIPLEPVYTGKMLYALYDLIAKGKFNLGSRIITLHTGGLQGNRSFCNRDAD